MILFPLFILLNEALKSSSVFKWFYVTLLTITCTSLQPPLFFLFFCNFNSVPVPFEDETICFDTSVLKDLYLRWNNLVLPNSMTSHVRVQRKHQWSFIAHIDAAMFQLYIMITKYLIFKCEEKSSHLHKIYTFFDFFFFLNGENIVNLAKFVLFFTIFSMIGWLNFF